MKKAYAYARFSSDRQREESIDAQLRAIREYCDREGIAIVHVFADRALSGTTDKRRLHHSCAKLFYKISAQCIRRKILISSFSWAE